jgi:tetratricopeptide (TPR) repeat protein
MAKKAVALDDKESMAHFALGRVQNLRGEYATGVDEFRAAIDLNPSLALAHLGLAFALILTGQLDEAVFESDVAIRLSPRDPYIWVFYNNRAWAHLLLEDYEAAEKDARSAIRHPAARYWPFATLASTLALLDRREEARIALETLQEDYPDFSPHAALEALSPLNPKALRPKFKKWIEGLREAGLDIVDEPNAADQ